MEKKEIRQQIKQLLNQNKQNLKTESERICEKIIYSEIYKKSTTILAYMALPDEVDLSTVIEKALSDNKKIFLPHVYPATSKMEFFQFTKDTPVVIGEYGIKEPDFTESTPRYISDESETLFLIPGRAFTKNGDRLGRGKGFYDYYLEPLKDNYKIIKAGVCFPCQLIKEIPTTKNDVAMDFLFY